MNGYIYKITNKINEKIYIGKTLQPIYMRFKEHCKDAFRDRNEKRPLYAAMRKYGTESFEIELIEEISIDRLSEREMYWIEKYDSYHNGYNATRGGDGKQLYDYQAIIQGFLSGKLIKELAVEFECCEDTISQALKLANIDTKQNSVKSTYKKLIAYDLNDNVIQEFESRKAAVLWLQSNNYTKATDIDNINAAIGRAANGKRATAYGMKWKNI